MPRLGTTAKARQRLAQQALFGSQRQTRDQLTYDKRSQTYVDALLALASAASALAVE